MLIACVGHEVEVAGHRYEHGTCGIEQDDALVRLSYAEVIVFTKILKIGPAKLLVVCSSVALSVTACKPGADSTRDTSQIAQGAQASNPDSSILLRGSVVSVSANQVVLKSDTGTITVAIAQPFQVYTRAASDLS